MEDYLTLSALASLLTLTGLEIVLGIDNVIFIAILVGKLPERERAKVRNLGLFLAMFMRIGLLLFLTSIMKMEKELFHVFGGELGKALHRNAACGRWNAERR